MRHGIARQLAAGSTLALSLLLTGCQTGTVQDSGDGGAIAQHQRDSVLAQADWDKKIDITIQMHDYGYRPREITLKRNQPYRITLVNNGSLNHYFTAPEFLASVATRKVEVRNHAEVKAPVFTSFELQARGGSLDIYLIPLQKGSYRAHCHMKDHLTLGIEGVLTVE